MLNRRRFLGRVLSVGASVGALGLVRCAGDAPLERSDDGLFTDRNEVILYDCHAMALYFDGGLGPKTGVIKVDYILGNAPVEMEFWHGHGGKQHRFTLLPEHYLQIKQLKKVTIETTQVDGHAHKLFIDFNDSRWRVAGAKPIAVPLGLIRV